MTVRDDWAGRAMVRQFSVVEPTFPSGEFGVFVRSTGEEDVSVTFSDFEVYDVKYVLPTRTPWPTP